MDFFPEHKLKTGDFVVAWFYGCIVSIMITIIVVLAISGIVEVVGMNLIVGILSSVVFLVAAIYPLYYMNNYSCNVCIEQSKKN